MDESVLAVVSNAGLAALSFLWMFIGIAHWTRRKRPLHLAGATTMATLMMVFLLRTFIVAQPPLLPVPITTDVIRWLWFLSVLMGLVYSTVYLLERQLHLWPSKHNGESK